MRPFSNCVPFRSAVILFDLFSLRFVFQLSYLARHLFVIVCQPVRHVLILPAMSIQPCYSYKLCRFV